MHAVLHLLKKPFSKPITLLSNWGTVYIKISTSSPNVVAANPKSLKYIYVEHIRGNRVFELPALPELNGKTKNVTVDNI